jgi:formate-dependent nitrite reductase membrane component NrfD
VFFLRYLDVCLVLATAPFVLAAGLPVFGYLIGAAAWILTRAATAVAHAQARRAGDAKVKAGLHVAAMMGRIWLVALALVLARYAGGKDDGIMAAALALGAFTVYFLMSFVTHEGPLQGGAHPHGRPSAS